MAYIQQPQQLDGLNIFKAIGRAIGSTGRAVLSALPIPGASVAASVLDSAARMPASKKVAPPLQTPQPSMNTDSGATSTSLVKNEAAPQRDAVMDLLTTLVAKQTQPQIQPTAIPQFYQPQPAYQPQAQTGAAPSWMVPAAIAGAGLMLVMAMRK